MATDGKNSFGIRDNYGHGKVSDFLVGEARPMAASFPSFRRTSPSTLTRRLAENSTRSSHCVFFLVNPASSPSLDPEKTDKKLSRSRTKGWNWPTACNRRKSPVAVPQWISDKVEIRSIRQANLLHGKLYHIDDGHREHAILGSSNFTRRGLGLSSHTNIELNLVVDSDRDRAELKAWFDEIWADETLVEM